MHTACRAHPSNVRNAGYGSHLLYHKKGSIDEKPEEVVHHGIRSPPTAVRLHRARTDD